LDKHSFPNGKRLVRDTLKPDDNLHYEKFSDGTVKCIEDEIPFELPEGWEWTRLGCITDVIQYGLSNSAESTGDYRLLRITDIQNGCVNWDTVPFTSTDEPEKYLLHKDDIVFARTGATVGKSFLITDLPYASVYASYLIRIRLINGISANYIYHFFNSYCYWEQVTDKAVGVGQPNCNGTALRELFIPLPSQAEQNRIVPVADNLLKIVDTITSEQESLSELIQTTKSKILDLAIRGKLVPQDPNDEPASVLLERIRAEKEELIKQGKIKRDKKESVIFKGDDNSYYEKIGDTVTCIDDKIPFEIPESWCWTRLNHITINHDSYRKPINSSDRKNRIVGKEKSKLYPYYGATGQVGLIDDYLFDGEYILLGEDAAPFLDKNAQKAYMIIGKSWVNNHAHILKPLILSKYLTHCLNSINYLNYVYGTTRLKLTQENMNKILIPVPPFKEQQRLIHKIDSIMGSINQINLSNKSK
jgi:type I restriction enzyme S subunit